MSEDLQEYIGKAGTLIEALPYMQNFRGETFLIKVGGAAMEDPDLVESVLRDVVFLEAVGINPVIVHGGGKAISRAMDDEGLEAKFVGGMRVTDEPAIEMVEKVLDGIINPSLVYGIDNFGGTAVGVSGKKVFAGEKAMSYCAEQKQEVDVGYVGKVVGFDTKKIVEAISKEVVPVVSPLAAEKETGHSLNVNADVAAAALAGAIGATKVLFISDVRGVLGDPADAGSLIATLTEAEAEGMIESGAISGGMIPKVRSATVALDAGVRKAHLIDGRIAHSLILEIFTDLGIGTMITANN